MKHKLHGLSKLSKQLIFVAGLILAASLFSYYLIAQAVNKNHSVQKTLTTKTIPMLVEGNKLHEEIHRLLAMVNSFLATPDQFKTKFPSLEINKIHNLTATTVQNILKLERYQSNSEIRITLNKIEGNLAQLFQDIHTIERLVLDQYLNTMSRISVKRESLNKKIDTSLVQIKKQQVLNQVQASRDNESLQQVLISLSQMQSVINQISVNNEYTFIIEIKNNLQAEIRKLLPEISKINNEDIKKDIAQTMEQLLLSTTSAQGLFEQFSTIAQSQAMRQKLINNYQNHQHETLRRTAHLFSQLQVAANHNFAQLEASTTFSQLLIYIIMIIIFIIQISIIFFYLKPNVINRMKQINTQAKKLTKGKYDLEIITNGNDEISALAQALETFRIQLIERQELLQAKDSTNKEVESYTQQLQQSLTKMDEFVNLCGHELKEPLRIISSYSSIIADDHDSKLTEQSDYAIKKIILTIDRMKNLITSLTNYALIDNPHELKFETIDLNTLLNTVQQNLEGDINHSQAKIIAHDLPSIYAVPRLVEQLFENIIGNALKYHKDGIRPQVNIFAVDYDTETEIVFTDNGIGIEAPYLDKIFILFQRLHSREKYNGSGVGLTLCQKVTQVHHGRITVESTPDIGTSFHVFFPKPSSKEK